MECDPCAYCQHCFDDSDESVGLYGLGCDSDNIEAQEFDPETTTKPCPDFKPFLASDGLFEQLQYEDDAKFWQDIERKAKGESEV